MKQKYYSKVVKEKKSDSFFSKASMELIFKVLLKIRVFERLFHVFLENFMPRNQQTEVFFEKWVEFGREINSVENPKGNKLVHQKSLN